MLTRRELIVALVSGSMAIAAVTLAQSPGQPLMKSTAFDWNEAKVESKPYGERRGVLQGRTATMDELECHVTTINPGQRAHAPHQHPEEELIIIKEGTVESLQNGQSKTLGPGSILFEASGELHGVRNVGDTPASYYVIKFYPPGMKFKATAEPAEKADPKADAKSDSAASSK